MYAEGVKHPEEVLKKLYKGTTTVGIVGEDFTVLATDRRATSGYFIASKHARKIAEIDRHVAVTIAGTVGDAQQLVERLRAEARLYRVEMEAPIPVKSLATLASLILFQNRPLLLIQMLVGGVDREEGATLYSVDWLGTVTKENYIATGSGTPFAVAILESEYKEGIKEEEAVKLAVKAVRAAMQRDPASGEGVDVAIVKEDGIRFIRGESVSL